MSNAGTKAPEWTKLGSHSARINAIIWSSKGELFSASCDGEIRKWTDKPEVIRSPDGECPVQELAWSSGRGELIASVANKIAVYKNGASTAYPNVSAVYFRSDSAGYYLALSEVQVTPTPFRWWLRLREIGSLGSKPVLSHDLGTAGRTIDFAWHPTRRWLAVLSDSRIIFACPLPSTVFSYSWSVGPQANSIAWISDDELAVGYSDANIRIFSHSENEPRQGGEHQPKTKTVLEAHEHQVVAISKGWNDRIFVTGDVSGCLHVWSTAGLHLATLAIPAHEMNTRPIIAVHPDAPVVATASATAVYRRSLDISRRPARTSHYAAKSHHQTLQSRLLRRGGIAPPEKLTSDDIASRGKIALEAIHEDVPRLTLQLRRLAKSVGALDLVANESLDLLWKHLDRSEIIAFENEDLAPLTATDTLSEAEIVRRRIRKVLLGVLTSTSNVKSHLALCAYTALGYVQHAAWRELSESSEYAAALDRLHDDEARRKLKTHRIAAGNLETAVQTTDLLEEIAADLRGLLKNLPSESNAKTKRKGDAMVDTKKIEDFIVIGAKQEMAAVRDCLDELGYKRERKFLRHRETSRRIETFLLERGEGEPPIVVGLMLAQAKGKTGTKSLLEFIKASSRPRHVVMVGMMAALKDKAELLDVVVPATIYDLSAIGTKGGRLVSEPEFGRVDATMHNMVHSFEELKYRRRRIEVITHKKTVTFSAKIDDAMHELAAAALQVDTENIIGLEMEGSALAEMQSSIGKDRDGYLMIKGVADYAGAIPDEPEIAKLKKMPSLAKLLSTPDPTNSKEWKYELQREATCRALVVALELLRTLAR